MKLIGILVALIFTANSVYGLWSSKCKDAETSTDKVVQLIQNANCTLIAESRRFYVNLNNIRDRMRNKMEIFKELFRKNKEVNEDENLDYGIDVRMSADEKGEDNPSEDLNSRRKRQSNEAENENEESSNDAQQPENQENVEEEEQYEGVLKPKAINILVAPNQCRPGQRYVSGRCRTLVFFD
ncbi:hypothetical protein ACKWTF_006120 [Chironomus riparius]